MNLQVRIVTLDRKIAKQLPVVNPGDVVLRDNIKVLGNLAYDALERGSEPVLICTLNDHTVLMRRQYSQWELSLGEGPRIILQ